MPRYRTQWGFGITGNRTYSKSILIKRLRLSDIVLGQASVSIQTVSGTLLGQLRTDIQKTIVHSLKFKIDEQGCQDLEVKLTGEPDFPLLPFALIEIRVNDSSDPWYAGEILIPDQQKSRDGLITYKARGFVRYFESWKATGESETIKIIPRGTDIGEAVRLIAEQAIQGRSGVRYNPSKINTQTGSILTNDVELGKYSLKKIFETFSTMTNHVWGVDANRDFYFLSRNQNVLKTFLIGYDLHDFSPRENQENVKNVIMVQRKQGRSASDSSAGWAVAGIYNDATSVKKYGRKELNYQVPGFFSNQDCQTVGQALLRDNKEPRLFAKVKDFSLGRLKSPLALGKYRFVSVFSTVTQSFLALDGPLENGRLWQKKGSGDLGIFQDSNFFVFANGSLKLSFQNANGDNIEYTKNFKTSQIQSFSFYVRSTSIGSYLQFGFGIHSIEENLYTIGIDTANTFLRVSLDVWSLNLSKIAKVGFKVKENTQASTTVYLDKLDITYVGFTHYNLDLTASTYQISSRNQSVNLDIGPTPNRLENFIADLFTQASELRFTQEV